MASTYLRGTLQPGCWGQESLDLSCSHRRAWQIYAESIKSLAFYAIQCPNAIAFAKGHCCHSTAMLNAVKVGEPLGNLTRGIYHLYTNDRSPLAKSKEESTNCDLTSPN